MQFIDAELEKLNARIAVMSTARMAYASTLREILEAEAGTTPIGSGSDASIEH
jgi:ATP-dependent protease HslVU (ClpYQ) peptidase subunit